MHNLCRIMKTDNSGLSRLKQALNHWLKAALKLAKIFISPVNSYHFSLACLLSYLQHSLLPPSLSISAPVFTDLSAISFIFTKLHPKKTKHGVFCLRSGDNCLGYRVAAMWCFSTVSYKHPHTPTLTNTASLKSSLMNSFPKVWLRHNFVPFDRLDISFVWLHWQTAQNRLWWKYVFLCYMINYFTISGTGCYISVPWIRQCAQYNRMLHAHRIYRQ